MRLFHHEGDQLKAAMGRPCNGQVVVNLRLFKDSIHLVVRNDMKIGI